MAQFETKNEDFFQKIINNLDSESTQRTISSSVKLFNEFLSRGKNTQRQLFWVIKTNQNAIKRYRHYGFEKEKMSNFILTNKNLSYEE